MPDLAPDRDRTVSLTHTEACYLLEIGRMDEAVAIGRQLRDWGWRSRYPAGRGYGLHIEALAAAAQGRARRAAELLDAAVALTRGQDPCGMLSWQLAELAAAKASLGGHAVDRLLAESEATEDPVRHPRRASRLLAVAYAMACQGKLAEARARLAALADECVANDAPVQRIDALTLLARLGVFPEIPVAAPEHSPVAAVRVGHIQALTRRNPAELMSVSDQYADLRHWHLAAELADAAADAGFRRGDTGGQRAAARRNELMVECDAGPLPWWSIGKPGAAGC
ncbi:hypothetical protein [Longispora albida]|uniref:hypothetical protein n=1 Tax=Longispora albida TaxID=203523 RepID=UPI000380A6B5|nr:hypothetical protein [Longispora albida]